MKQNKILNVILTILTIAIPYAAFFLIYKSIPVIASSSITGEVQRLSWIPFSILTLYLAIETIKDIRQPIKNGVA